MKQIPKVLEAQTPRISDQDFTFLSKDIYSKHFASEEESINSLDKLLNKRGKLNTQEITEEGFIPSDISKLVDQGKAIFNSLTKPAQLIAVDKNGQTFLPL
jgi:hypothetical protein